MSLTRHRPTGPAFLDAVTTLLQDARLADPRGGQWEAADLQWWSRLDRRSDPSRHCFWYRGDTPVVAAVLTDWRGDLGVDLLGTDADVAEWSDELWGFVDEALDGRPADTLIRTDDVTRVEAAQRNGFAPTEHIDRTAWLDAGMRPRPVPPAAGYELVSYTGGTHPMQRRNGDDVADRLAECSLYDRELDLAVRAADGSVAGYALFWADHVTGIGLVEPMRVEDAHQGRGLGRTLLTEGLNRLAAHGCSQLKVSFEPANAAAAALYTGAGFRVRAESRTYRRAAGPR